MIEPAPRPSHAASARTVLPAAAILLAACAGGMQPPRQGITGAFLTYGPPRELADCAALAAGSATQAELDDCRRQNERVIEEPYRAAITVRNLQTEKIHTVQLDEQGAYRIDLDPGEYEVCVAGECSDPLSVRLRNFERYGQRLPRPSGDPARPAAPVKMD